MCTCEGPIFYCGRAGTLCYAVVCPCGSEGSTGSLVQKKRAVGTAILECGPARRFGLLPDKFCGPGRSSKAVLAKEVPILIGRGNGATVTELSLIAGLDTSNVSRRSARQKLQTDRKLAYARSQAEKIYLANIAESQTRHRFFRRALQISID